MFLLCDRLCLRARAVFPRPSLPAGRDRVPASESACGQGGVPASESAFGQSRVPASESACGQGLRTGAHLRCFPSRRCAAGPSRSRSHGRLRRPKSLPIRHSPAAAQCLTPLGWRDCLRFDLLAASIRKSGLEIGNRCRDCPCFDLMAASIRKSGPEIKNRCTVLPEIGPKAASIRKSGPEIENRCTISPKNGPAAAAIRKPGLEIKNHCSGGAISEHSLQRFPNLPPEFKNRCILPDKWTKE